MADLRDLGLSEYESRAYRALLDVGPATAKELSEASGVPMGRVYDVLNSLERHRLARSQAASRPKKYLAVEPDAALDRLLEEKQRELDEQAEQYEAVVDELSLELEAGDPPDEQFWTAALGPEETADLLLERLSAADDRVVMIAAAPASGLDIGAVGERITEELEAALERGVEVSLLLSEELPAQLPEGSASATSTGWPTTRTSRCGPRRDCAGRSRSSTTRRCAWKFRARWIRTSRSR